MAGAVFAGGRKQGSNDVYPEEIFAKFQAGVMPNPDEQMLMFENVTKFVIVDQNLRAQYLIVVVHNTVNHLNENFAAEAQHLSDDVAWMANLN